MTVFTTQPSVLLVGRLVVAMQRRGLTIPPAQLVFKVLIALMLAIGLLGWFSGQSTRATAVNPLTCEGYPQKRHFIDAQSWWTTTPGKSGTDFGHVHVGACVPEREHLTSNQSLDIRMILHNNPGTVDYASMIFKGTSQEEKVWQSTGGQSCPNPGTCTFWFTAPIDISKFSNSGLQEVRFRVFVDEPDGNRMIASLNWQTHIDNGKPRSDVSRRPYLRGKGWYTDVEYCEAALKSVPLPNHPVSGVWNPYAHIVWHGTSNDAKVTAHSIRLDSDAHAGLAGTVLQERAGEFSGTVPIDTTTLADGRHRLILRADCDTPDGSTNSGVLIVFFEADNTRPTVTSVSQRLAANRAVKAASTQPTVPVTVNWSSSDNLTPPGKLKHHVQRRVQTDGVWGPWTTVLGQTTSKSGLVYLAPGTNQFTVQTTDMAGNRSLWKRGPVFSVSERQETSASIIYNFSRAWSEPLTLSGAYGGRVKHAGLADARARITFAGRNIAWVAPRGSDRGKAEIYQVNGDGTKIKLHTVDLYAATYAPARLVYTKTWTTLDTRTIEVRVTGNKQASSAGTRVDLDAFVILR